jgi:hypothetical protein
VAGIVGQVILMLIFLYLMKDDAEPSQGDVDPVDRYDVTVRRMVKSRPLTFWMVVVPSSVDYVVVARAWSMAAAAKFVATSRFLESPETQRARTSPFAIPVMITTATVSATTSSTSETPASSRNCVDSRADRLSRPIPRPTQFISLLRIDTC